MAYGGPGTERKINLHWGGIHSGAGSQTVTVGSVAGAPLGKKRRTLFFCSSSLSTIVWELKRLADSCS